MEDYFRELNFIDKYFTNISVPFSIIDTGETDKLSDVSLFELYKIVFSEHQFEEYFKFALQQISHNVIYRIKSELLCHYFAFRLPSTEKICIIGSYLTHPITDEELKLVVDSQNLPEKSVEVLRAYYDKMILIEDDSSLLALINTFGEIIWKSYSNFILQDIDRTFLSEVDDYAVNEAAAEPDSLLIKMNSLTERYQTENLLLEAISKGEVHRSEMIFAQFSSIRDFEVRSKDIVKNHKNYTIILNTLLRKAAEKGDVHPFYLDKTSSAMAERIDKAKTYTEITNLAKEMVRKYALLVRNYSMSSYSPLIQQVLTIINVDLSADLSLNAIADKIHVNASYLSSQFKKEMGVTLTDFVTQKRVNHAIFLINSSNIPIATIAANCGIPDVQYFSKIFKKRLGMSPSQYRKMVKGN